MSKKFILGASALLITAVTAGSAVAQNPTRFTDTTTGESIWIIPQKPDGNSAQVLLSDPVILNRAIVRQPNGNEEVWHVFNCKDKTGNTSQILYQPDKPHDCPSGYTKVIGRGHQ